MVGVAGPGFRCEQLFTQPPHGRLVPDAGCKVVKKILVLTAGFGEGHNAAARSLRDALEHIDPSARVEVLDLFEVGYGRLNEVAKKAYLGLVRYAPGLWNGVYRWLDTSEMANRNLGAMGRLNHALADVLKHMEPDCVVSCYPAYAHAIRELFRDHQERPFRFGTIITDSITVNSAWFKAPSDWFCVANEPTGQVLRKNGIPADQVKALGFPVNRVFAEPLSPPLESPTRHGPRVLYIINTGKKKAGKMLDRLMEIPRLHLTITCGRDAELKTELTKRTADFRDRVDVLGWTNQMPKLMRTHHLIIGKAGGATVQEAIAASCPMVINQVIPGQEEGNATLIQQLEGGIVADGTKDVARAVEETFGDGAAVWKRWRKNLEAVSRPDASLRIAEMVLEDCSRQDRPGNGRISAFPRPSGEMPGAPAFVPSNVNRNLLCDFHIHTNYSDGKLTVAEVVDFYGKHGFDCICITDHLADPRRLIGKLSRLTNLTLAPSQLEEYFEVIERERRRALRRYGMHVMTGIEFNKDGLSKKSSAHLLGVDLQDRIDPALDLEETIARIHSQGGLAIASHPHVMKSEWGKDTLYLWENQETFVPLLDAWEIANRNNIFTPVGLKQLPFVANSDFHKPKHINSWKTLLHCEKDPSAIKQCIRDNRNVAITLFRDYLHEASPQPAAFPLRLEPRRIDVNRVLAV